MVRISRSANHGLLGKFDLRLRWLLLLLFVSERGEVSTQSECGFISYLGRLQWKPSCFGINAYTFVFRLGYPVFFNFHMILGSPPFLVPSYVLSQDFIKNMLERGDTSIIHTCSMLSWDWNTVADWIHDATGKWDHVISSGVAVSDFSAHFKFACTVYLYVLWSTESCT